MGQISEGFRAGVGAGAGQFDALSRALDNVVSGHQQMLARQQEQQRFEAGLGEQRAEREQRQQQFQAGQDLEREKLSETTRRFELGRQEGQEQRDFRNFMDALDAQGLLEGEERAALQNYVKERYAPFFKAGAGPGAGAAPQESVRQPTTTFGEVLKQQGVGLDQTPEEVQPQVQAPQIQTVQQFKEVKESLAPQEKALLDIANNEKESPERRVQAYARASQNVDSRYQALRDLISRERILTPEEADDTTEELHDIRNNLVDRLRFLREQKKELPRISGPGTPDVHARRRAEVSTSISNIERMMNDVSFSISEVSRQKKASSKGLSELRKSLQKLKSLEERKGQVGEELFTRSEQYELDQLMSYDERAFDAAFRTYVVNMVNQFGNKEKLAREAIEEAVNRGRFGPEMAEELYIAYQKAQGE